MADPRKRLKSNQLGEFFVDSTCINCDTCRQLASSTFGETGGYSFVKSQPQTDSDIRDATRALLSCPTGSIGTEGPNAAKAVMLDFPLQIEDEVYYCGFNSPKSYGGNSYFVQHSAGNWLIDSPKYLPHLAQKFEKLGGIRYIFLTHRDDVADAAKYAEHFGATRIIHQNDASAARAAERIISGTDDQLVEPEFRVIPTPGHTAGHCVLLYRDRFLFTGDHMWWDPDTDELGASTEHCWYSWDLQKESLAKLMDYSFEWVLPGHGSRVHLPKEFMEEKMRELVAWTQKAA